MKATITYKLSFIPDPWDEKRRRGGNMVWALVKVVRPEIDVGLGTREEPVACFNFDSEAKMFQAHVVAAGLDGKLVDVDPEIADIARQVQAMRRAPV